MTHRRSEDTIQTPTAGKEVNLIVWTTEYGPGASATPSYVLNQVNTTQCAQPSGQKTAITPIFWEPGFASNYEVFISALIQRYQNNPSIGYVRFGLGTGGEDFPLPSFTAPQCLSQLRSYGYSPQVWLNYTYRMLDYEASLHSQKQLMVGINSIPSQNGSIVDLVAARAVQDGIGFGSQGLTSLDIQRYKDNVSCAADWCNLFSKYAGRVPLELQTYSASSPDGSGIGSLPQMLSFALSLHTQIFEVYVQDFLTAYAPPFQNYSEFHASYAQAFENTAAVVGSSAVQSSANSLGMIVCGECWSVRS